MGMSASQTRYVLLTGKKSDVEYHGQQINQQRTTLATESSAYNAQLLNLHVPTPPSASDFTKTTYTLQANGETYTVTGTQYQANAYTMGADTFPGGTNIVYYTNETTGPQGKSSGSALFSRTTDATTGLDTYRIGQGTTSTVLDPVNLTPGTPGYDPAVAANDASNIALITKDTGATGPFFKYTSGNITKYVTLADLQASASTPTTPSTTAIPTYYVDANAQFTEHSKIGGAKVTWNESGRMTSITDANGNTFALTVNTTSDNSAYTDAMNEYEYQKSLYDQEMNNINAKMSIIQSEDKKLELQLKDLDTQNNAIQTEMESVKKVVDKNIEQSFKAFA